MQGHAWPSKKMREAFAKRGTKMPGKKFDTHKELNVLIEDAVKKALAKTDGSSTSNASDEELEVFNATAELQQLNLNTEKNSNAYVAWCLLSHSPFNGYDVWIVKIPNEDLKLLDNITSISNFKK